MKFNERKSANARASTVVQAQGAPESEPKAEVNKDAIDAKVAPAEAPIEKAEAPAQTDVQDTKR